MATTSLNSPLCSADHVRRDRKSCSCRQYSSGNARRLLEYDFSATLCLNRVVSAKNDVSVRIETRIGRRWAWLSRAKSRCSQVLLNDVTEALSIGSWDCLATAGG